MITRPIDSIRYARFCPLVLLILGLFAGRSHGAAPEIGPRHMISHHAIEDVILPELRRARWPRIIEDELRQINLWYPMDQPIRTS